MKAAMSRRLTSPVAEFTMLLTPSAAGNSEALLPPFYRSKYSTRSSYNPVLFAYVA